jgi:hypothetical protein
MNRQKQRKPAVSTKAEAESIANAAVGAVVGAVIAGPVGAIAGAAIGALVEKGPHQRKPRKQPPAPPSATGPRLYPGERRPLANRKNPAGNASRRKPGVTIAPSLAGAGPDVRITSAKRK